MPMNTMFIDIRNTIETLLNTIDHSLLFDFKMAANMADIIINPNICLSVLLKTPALVLIFHFTQLLNYYQDPVVGIASNLSPYTPYLLLHVES